MSKRLILLVAASLLAFLAPRSTGFAQESGGGAATKNNLDLPFNAGGKPEEEEEAPEIVIFFGQQYEGDGIFFSCDKSGSMNEAGKWPKLQREMVKNITQFSERVQFGIVFFDAGMFKFPASGRPADANPAMKAAGVAMVMSTQPGHGTCAKPALNQCLNYATQSSAKRKLIIHLSDGWNTCGGADDATVSPQILSEITQRNTQRVHINTIGFGDPVNEDFMKKLASMNNGQYAHVSG